MVRDRWTLWVAIVAGFYLGDLFGFPLSFELHHWMYGW